MMRINREIKTVRNMIGIYCRGNHGGGKEICAECRELMSYAEMRISKCRYGEDKPVCSRCTTHCYKPVMREAIRRVMRYAGPKMTYRHPLQAVRHLIVSYMR